VRAAPTIRDVARRARVGVGTVSRVLNDSPRVDPGTRERVLAAIAELDYVPSAIARSLSTGRTGAIGVIVPFLTRPSVVERLRGVEAALSSTPYDLVVFNIETPKRRETVIRLLTRGGRVDGLILLSLSPHPGELAMIERTGIPTVLVDGHHRLLNRVVVDDVAGGRLAASHLLELGHHRIGFLGDDPLTRFKLSPSRLRRMGVAAALRCAGLELRPEYVHAGGFPRETARRAGAELLALTPPATAIVCGSDVEALGVLEAARLASIPVPGALSVIGYDDIEIAGDLGLTTIRQPLFESGRRGVALLLKAMGGAAGRPTRQLLPVELMVRATTGPPAASGPFHRIIRATTPSVTTRAPCGRTTTRSSPTD
jgi:DNA-binding LacI/PurR family transcriptional regulator